MDYDENDFQSQNLRLAGEGSTEFPPVIRPYSLPKFDFDESLQEHLRFDSLVETEVFLGIESQEDNHWIEDFSQTSSGIEFSPCAAESCSISRRNNAWSEATSSESVEMLLKSVGQEEMIPGKIIKESDAHDELGNLTSTMEPTLEQDDSSLPIMAEIVDSGSTSPSGKFLKSFPRLNEHVGGNLMQIEGSLQTHKGDSSAYRSPSNFEPRTAGENCGLPATERSLLDDSKCNVVNDTEVNLSVHNFPVSRTEDLSATEMQEINNILMVGDLVTSTQIVTSTGEANSQEASSRVSNEKSDSIHSRNYSGGEEQHVLSNKLDDWRLEVGAVKSCNNDTENAISAVSGVDSILKRNVAESISKNVEETSVKMLKGDSDLQIVEGLKADLCSRSPVQASEEVVSFCNNKEREDQYEEGTCDNLPIALVGDSRSMEHGLEVCNSIVGNRNSDTQYKQSSVVKRTNLLESGHQTGSEILVSNSEVSLLPVEDCKVLNLQSAGSGISHVEDDPHLTLACPSPESLGRTNDTENFKDLYDSRGIFSKESYSEEVSSSTLENPMSACEKIDISQQTNVQNYERGSSVFEKGETELLTGAGNVECLGAGSIVTDGMLGSSFYGKCITENEVIIDKSKLDTPKGHKTASGIVLEHGVPLPPQDGVTSNEVIDRKFNELPSLGVMSLGLDKSEETGINVSKESSLLILKDCSVDRNAMHVVSRDEKDVSINTEQLLHETSNRPLSVVENFKVESRSEARAAVDNPSQEVSEELGGSPVICDSVLKDVNAETVLPNNTEEETSRTSYEEASLIVSVFSDAEQISNEGEKPTLPVPSSPKDSGREVKQNSLVPGEGNRGWIIDPSSGGNSLNSPEGSLSAACLPEVDGKFSVLEDGNGCEESGKPNCGSPTVISCVDLPQHEKQFEEGDKGSADLNLAVCEVNGGATKEACSVSTDPKGNDPSKDDRSFTFKVTPLPDSSEREAGKSWQPFCTIQACQISEIAQGSYRSTLSQMDSKLEQETTRGNPTTSNPQIVRGGSKSTDCKTRRASGKARGKEAAKKVNYQKEESPVRQSERGDKSFTVSPVVSGTSHLVPPEGMLHSGRVAHCGTKKSGTFTGTSNLPDLNASASTPVLFQQPFTDMQQLQLRAQIFVYGSLILGAAPDEACMITAFGESDGGRSIWENAWRSCVEMVHVQKYHPSNLETLLPSRTDARSPVMASKHGALQSKLISMPVGRASNKVAPSTVVSSMVALSSPLWSMSTPSSDGLQPFSALPSGAVLDYNQALSPLHTYQTSPLRNFVGHTSWLSQTPFPVPWIDSQQTSALDASARFSTLPITETVRPTPVRESSVPHSSGIKHVSPIPMTQSGSPGSAFAGSPASTGIKRGTLSPGGHSADLKPRKRKKNPVSEDLMHMISSPSQIQKESVLATGVTNRPSTCAVGTSIAPTPAFGVSKTDSSELITAVSSSLTPVNDGNQDAQQSITLSEETLNKVKEAKLQAEEAAAHATAAVSHSQCMWTQLDKQKHSGLVSDVEAALASAAVAVAASASVAKAAAAAAKIASNAALQAKLMADEALEASGNGSFSPNSGISHSDRISSASSIITAAREAARRRVEAASAASKQAENFDALVKAAELVAEAVSHAGKVVAMGDPLPLSQLVEASPEGCCKFPQVSSDPVVKSNHVKGDQLNVYTMEKGPHNFAECSERPVEKIKTQTKSHEKPSSPRGSCRDSMEDHITLVDGTLGSVTNCERELRRQEGCKAYDVGSTIGVVPESEFGSRSAAIDGLNESGKGVENLKEECIKEGSLVEVFKDGNAYKAAWFFANVLSLEDRKACVCYTELLSDDGSGQLKEWVALEGEGGKAPRVRIARSVIATGVEGTKKRQRAAMGDYTWSVGDRVDAWIKDCWWEGVIAEMHEKDGTAFTVSFPGETSVVRAWHLQSSLIWKDGEWIQWSSSRESDYSSHEGNMHRVKRPRLAGPAVEATGKDELSKSIDVGESGKPEEPGVLALSANERIFDVGKNSRDGIKRNRLKTVQAGLRKEGPGVIFGIPKPGKRRKFMDVSKHYIAGQSNKTNQVSDSAKPAKILIPPGSGSRGASRFDIREKRAAESKLKSGKLQNLSSRSASHKNKLLTSAVSTPGEGGGTNDLANIVNSYSHDENTAHNQNLTEFGSFTNTKGEAEDTILLSSSAYPPDAPSSKKVPTFTAKSERMGKGILASFGGKLAKIEENKVFTGSTSKSTSEVIEPRRSNRRIQPTSRLLEGLQSSLIISKVPSVSHDRAQKSQNRSVSRGSNRG